MSDVRHFGGDHGERRDIGIERKAGHIQNGAPKSSTFMDGSTAIDPSAWRTPRFILAVICELLVNDYSRKGFFDGRSARLPTVIIRPGEPNAAASSWASGMFREPLAGEPCLLPVRRDQCHP